MNDDTDTTRPALAAAMTPERRRLWVRAVLGCLDITAAQKTVLIALETFADYRDGTNAHPGEGNLAQICGLTTRAVRTALAKAQDLGFIERTGAPNSRVGRAAVYRLTAPDATTGTAVPVNNFTTGTAVPVNNSTTGTAVHHDRNGHDTTTGTAVPPTLQPPSNHHGVSPQSGTSPRDDHDGTHTDEPPSRFCDRHPHGTRDDCGGCGNARTAFAAWKAAHNAAAADGARAAELERRRRRQLIENCPHCDDFGRTDDLEKCQHDRAPALVGYG